MIESGWWNSTQRSNGNGTYTFTSLDAYNAGTPATYTIRVGDPLVDYSQTKAGWFLQDDFRPSRTLQLSFGLRQEIQTQVDSKLNLAPRAAFTWNATKKTTMRGGYGIFYDWYESNLYEQTIRVDGNHQVDHVIQNPGFPIVEGGGTRLPPSVIRSASLDQPIIQQASIGLERPLAAWADFRADYMWTRGSSTLRSINVNAPLNGVRPDPLVGNISEIQSSGKRASDRVTVALNARYIPRRILGMVMYQFGSARNYADGADRAAVRQPQPRPRLGSVGAGCAPPDLLQLQRAARPRHSGRPQRAGLVGAALQHHHRLRRQRRHGVQRPSRRRHAQQRPRRLAVECRACGSTSRSASAACAPARPTCRACRRLRRRQAAARRRSAAPAAALAVAATVRRWW